MKMSHKVALLGLSVLSTQTAFAITADFYGFIKASYIHSDNSVASYGVDSIQAPTEAASKVATGTQTQGFRAQSKDAFQVAQSRFGFNLKKNDNLTGKIEFDFVDFTNHPIGKNDARLRIAEIAYRFSPSLLMRVGQGWSTFSGITTHSYNFVGGAFRSGGTGFLSQQAELKYTVGNFNFYGSVAQKGRNTGGYSTTAGTGTAVEQDVSSRGLPLLTAKAEYSNETQKIGVAYTQTKFDNENDGPSAKQGNTHSYGGKVFYQGKFGNLEVRSEAYMGANLNDLYMLSLAGRGIASATTVSDRDFEERGGFISLRQSLEGGHAIYGGVGMAEITSNLHDVGAGNATRNQHARLGYAHQIEEGFHAFIEGTRYETNHKKTGTATDVTVSTALMAEAGVNYTF